jgi:DNA-directed RNA polymerase specialized sigma24 family protein
MAKQTKGKIDRVRATAPALEQLYADWEATRDPQLYNQLIKTATDRIFTFYVGRIGYEDADIVSSNAAVRIIRALPGYQGTGEFKPLKQFDRKLGKFGSYVARVGKSSCLDYFKQRTAAGIGDEELVYKETAKLEYYDNALIDPWNSEGRKRTKAKPTESYYYERADPNGKVHMGVSSWSREDLSEWE